jgi:signal transduction histidine kinase
MGLLPCLRHGSDRWWLPCHLQVTEVMGEVLLEADPEQPLPPATHRRVLRTIWNDPPLMIFAALQFPGDTVDPHQLVDWLASQLSHRLVGGEAYLGEPTVTPAIAKQWNRLRDHFRTLPRQQWIGQAGLWLEVTGPPVPQGWKQQWPTLAEPEDVREQAEALSGQGSPPFHFLQQLARVVQGHRSLESSFDHRLRKNKLAALKQLAYGLSHEINNPLANISTRAQQLQRGEEDPTRAATLQRIVDQVYRAHEMIADLMFYANPSSVRAERFDLAELLTEVVAAYREPSQRHSIRLEIDLRSQPSFVHADPEMMREAVGALIRNAMEAIGSQGTIVVSLEPHDQGWQIHVADSGPGLSQQAREHAFDPYYSGREAGRGLGLGLCRVYRVVQLHHGELSLAGGPAGCVATILLRDAAGSSS